jgi:hypothetical protein
MTILEGDLHNVRDKIEKVRLTSAEMTSLKGIKASSDKLTTKKYSLLEQAFVYKVLTSDLTTFEGTEVSFNGK